MIVDTITTPSENYTQMIRKCNTCKKPKRLKEFYTYKRRNGERAHRLCCKECDKKRIAQWQKDNPERCKARKNESYKRNKYKIRKKFKKRYHSDPAFRKKVLAATREYNHERGGFEVARKRAQRNKDAAFAAYGGYKCQGQGCNVTDLQLLNIDHEGGRKRHNHPVKMRGDWLYSWLKTHNYPPGFRVLCFNCNVKEYHNGRKGQRW